MSAPYCPWQRRLPELLARRALLRLPKFFEVLDQHPAFVLMRDLEEILVLQWPRGAQVNERGQPPVAA